MFWNLHISNCYQTRESIDRAEHTKAGRYGLILVGFSLESYKPIEENNMSCTTFKQSSGRKKNVNVQTEFFSYGEHFSTMFRREI